VVRPDACALANNHLLDFGYQGSADTLDALSGAGLRAVGRAATKTKRNDPQSPPSRAVAGR
jgi:poly-gamma-glutamate synthesis protein (capsule biosynthesis protein)